MSEIPLATARSARAMVAVLFGLAAAGTALAALSGSTICAGPISEVAEPPDCKLSNGGDAAAGRWASSAGDAARASVKVTVLVVVLAALFAACVAVEQSLANFY